ncbi:DUF504 domain-containing protein [Candidatus Bathyarchaeota archaeon]|jgi:uncharacterized protein (UPF0248 family)|nr:MAG: DUF504 domain-containing protein [Candidatus Bathyarchaeota archaeon]
MREHPLKAILSRIIHGGDDPSHFELAYVHRGAADDQMVIKVSDIASLGKGSFLLRDGETQIPFHRVLYVLDSRKTLLWRKRQRETG